MQEKMGRAAEMEGTPPEMEANAEEAPVFKEAEAEALLTRKLPPMRLLASLIFC